MASEAVLRLQGYKCPPNASTAKSLAVEAGQLSYLAELPSRHICRLRQSVRYQLSMNAARPSKVWVWLNYALKLEDAVVVAVAIVAAYLNASKPASALAVSFHFMHRTLWRGAPLLPSFLPSLLLYPTYLCSAPGSSRARGQANVKSSQA